MFVPRNYLTKNNQQYKAKVAKKILDKEINQMK